MIYGKVQLELDDFCGMPRVRLEYTDQAGLQLVERLNWATPHTERWLLMSNVLDRSVLSKHVNGRVL